MVTRGMHTKFHASLLKPYVPNDDLRFPGREPDFYYDMGKPDEDEIRVVSIVDHVWKGGRPSFKVRWEDGDETTETLTKCNRLLALDDYLALHGVKSPMELPMINRKRRK